MGRLIGNGNKFVMRIGLVVFSFGLVVFAYLGYYNRYWADDWCYNADFRRLGFWGTMKGYSYITTYASNRFSLTLFSGLFYFGGLPGVQLVTLLIIIFWVLGLYRLCSHIAKMTSFKLPPIRGLLGAAVIIYYSIYLAPHLYQSLYWRSGLFPYTAPIVFGIWVFALITSRAVHEIHKSSLTIIAGVLSFLGGGFSEAGNATLTATLTVYVFACLIFRQKKWAKDTFPIAITALLASISAMVILIVSPTTAYRVGLYKGTTSLVEFPRLLLYYTFEFLVTDVLKTPLTHLLIFGTLLMIGMLAAPIVDNRIESKTWLGVSALIAVLTFIFVSASYSPSVYIEHGPPAPRAGIISQFIFVLGYGLTAFISGGYFRQYARWQSMAWIIPTMLILFYVYGAYSVVLSAEKMSIYAERAWDWDARDSQIRQSKEQGILEINVHGIDGLPVGGIRDFAAKHEPGYWVNNCAARYYGMESIDATSP